MNFFIIGNSHTCMIANVWPEPQHLEETISSIKFSSRVKMLTNDVKVNESNDVKFILKKYER